MTNSTRHHLERVVGSFGFTMFCFVVWGGLSALRARRVMNAPSFMEVLWLLYNATFAVLFLVRTRPKAVSLNPLHWFVALLASFSGFFFEAQSAGVPGASRLANGLIVVGIAGSGSAGIALRRSYDFVPALRGVTTDWLYRYVRHPMYLGSMVIRFGYLLRHVSAWNAVAFVLMIVLYVKRMDFEEGLMARDARYAHYMGKVRYRLLRGLY